MASPGETATRLWIFLLLCTGIPGNLFCCYQYLRNPRLRRRSSCHYLAALAVADAAFLLSLLATWLRTFDLTVDAGPVACPVLSYTTYTANLLSAWYIVAYTVERVAIVRNPFAMGRPRAAVRKAQLNIISMTVCGCLYNLWVPVMTAPRTLIANGTNETVCDITDSYLDAYETINAADTLLSFAAPLLVILPCHVYIITMLWLTRKRTGYLPPSQTTASDQGRAQEDYALVHSTPSRFRSFRNTDTMQTLHTSSRRSLWVSQRSTSSLHSHDGRSQWRVAQTERRLTLLLLAIALFYALANVPSHASRLLLNHCGLAPPEGVTSLFYNLFYTQYAANCWAYALFSQRWRCIHAAAQS